MVDLAQQLHVDLVASRHFVDRVSGLGFDKLTFLFIILIIGIILSLVALILELNFKPNQRNDQEVELSSREIDKLEKIVRRLLKKAFET